MTGFVGREHEIAQLKRLLAKTHDGQRDQPGIALLLRGRRRVGKSRLVQVFCERSSTPSVFFQASQGASAAAERAALAATVSQSDLAGRDLFAEGVAPPTWPSFFRLLAAALPDHEPSVVVIDELPWLLESDPTLEGALQTAWDTLLAKKPVFLIMIGSDLAMMEKLDDYRRPFHQRATVMALSPLNPYEVGKMLDLDAAQAFDAHLLTGGLPLICQDWTPGETSEHFLTASLADPTSALLVSGERSMAAEFPANLQAQKVLAAIGHGERTWSNIQSKLATESEPLAGSSLTNALRLLESKRVIAVDSPLSTKPNRKDRRYRVADPYLRFYLAFLRSGLSLIERGRPDLVDRQIQRSWTSWRGRAIEPIIRDALLRLAPDLGWPEVEQVGSWWNRQNNPEIDLIGSDRADLAREIKFAGSIKWHSSKPFGGHDLTDLIRGTAQVPGVDEATQLVAVSRSGFAPGLKARQLGPDDLIGAWAGSSP